MKRLVVIGLVLFLQCGFLMPSYAAQNQLDGDCVGEFRIDGKLYICEPALRPKKETPQRLGKGEKLK
jgi:hypothetical protein